MATKTSMSKLKRLGLHSDGTRKAKEKRKSHLSSLIMLGSQLLGRGRFNEGLPSFITNGLDSEQIWQQLELRNEHSLSLSACTREVVQISSAKQRKKPKVQSLDKEAARIDSDGGSDNDSDSDSNISGEDDSILDSIKKRLADESLNDKNDDFDDLSDSEGQDELDFDFEVDNEIAKGLSDEDEEGSRHQKTKNGKQKANVKKRSTVVDDKFFKLADMEQFLESEDLKEEKRIKREKQNVDGLDDEEENSDEDDEDEEIDMFANTDSEEEVGRNAKYTDFFDPPDDKAMKKGRSRDSSKGSKGVPDDEKLEEDDEEEEYKDGETEDMSDVESDAGEGDDDEDDDIDNKNGGDFADDGSSDGENSDEAEEISEKMKPNKKVSFKGDLFQSDDEEEDPEPVKSKETKSSFELKQEQLQAKAREMEEMSLKETPWELTGEASASKRPENSLLDTVLDFQHTTRAAPVITDETTKTLEDYIRQRIKDKTFDDVERKEKLKEDVFEFKKRIVLDQEKSKVSLGELYEQEFLKQQQQDTEEVKADPECEKIEKELNKLFHQLDALSNFRYTPMRPGTEVKIIVNTPAITMEEVAPVATAESELLAPEEVHEKRKGDLKADDERSTTDKKRARRQKKVEKRARKKAKEAREKVVEKLKPGLGNKHSKEKALKQLEQLSKTDRSVTLIKGDHGQKLTSSTSFFNQLQDEVQTNAKAKKTIKDKKRKIVDSSKLML